MIPEKKDSTLQTNCNTGNAFKVEANQFMFELLSSGLYKRKEEAVVRELCCNARDSHIMAGNDQPFKVILPTVFEPTLTVQDFGTGLSKEDVLSIYRVYGASNKRNSNDTIGGLGVGSKSPFCCTTSFTVESNYNGTFTQYLAYIDEESLPRITETFSQATTEPNGVTIKVPVKSNDIQKFNQAVSKVYSWIDMKPTVEGAEINLVDKTFEGDYIITNSPYDIKVLMGGVLYDCYFSEFCNNPLYVQGAVIKFDIGELAFAASRESIAATDKTRYTVLEKVTKISSELSHVIQEEINKLQYVSDLYTEDFPYSSKVLNLFKKDLKWKNTPLESLDLKVQMMPVKSDNLKDFLVDIKSRSNSIEVLLLDYPKYRRFVCNKIRWKSGCISEEGLPELKKHCDEIGVRLKVVSLKGFVESGCRPEKRAYSREYSSGYNISIAKDGGSSSKSLSAKGIKELVESFHGKVVYCFGTSIYKVQLLSRVFTDVMFIQVPQRVAELKTFKSLNVPHIKEFVADPKIHKIIYENVMLGEYSKHFSDVKSNLIDTGLTKEVSHCFNDKTLLRKFKNFNSNCKELCRLSEYLKEGVLPTYLAVSSEYSTFKKNFLESYPLLQGIRYTEDASVYIKSKYKVLKKEGVI